VYQARLAHPSLADHGYHLAVPRSSLLQHLLERRQLLLPSDEARQPRAALACKRRRSVLAPVSSKTSTGSVSPLTGNCPRALTWRSPSASLSVAAVSRMLPGVASCSMRAAKCVVWPMAE